MKVVLAGAQNPRALEDLIWAEAPNLLCSYEYLHRMKDKGKSTLQKIRDLGKWQITDSGVFTWKVRFGHMNQIHYTKDFPPQVNPHLQNHKQAMRIQRSTSDRANWVKSIKEWWGKGNGDDVEGLNCPYDPETQWDKCKEWAKDQLRGYRDGYYKWARDHAQYTNAIAELDCEWLIEEEIWEWREQLNEIVKQNSDNVDIIMTPHLYKSEADIRRIAQMTTYLGCDGAADNHPYWTTLMPVMKELKMRVHGWAVTDNASIKRMPFYSVDSTTWLGGAKYGSTYHYVGNWEMSTLPYQNKREHRAKFTAFCNDWGIDYEKLLDDHIPTVNLFNAKQWVLYSIDMEKDNTRAYWLDDSEKSDSIDAARKESGTDIAVIDRRGDDPVVLAQSSPTLVAARLCNTCFLNTKCPAYQPNSNCSVDMPISIGDSPAEFMKRMIEIQGQRVMFGAFAERMQGGVIDPALAKEMDLLFRITKTAHDISNPTQTESVTVTATKKNGGAGIISQIFGGGGYGRAGGGGSKPSQSETIIDVSPLKKND